MKIFLPAPGKADTWRYVLFLFYVNKHTCSPEGPLVAILEPGGEVHLGPKTEKRNDWLEQASPELAVGPLICFIGQFEITFLLTENSWKIANWLNIDLQLRRNITSHGETLETFSLKSETRKDCHGPCCNSILLYIALANEVQQIMDNEFWKGKLTDDIIISYKSYYFPFKKLKISNQKTTVRVDIYGWISNTGGAICNSPLYQ